LATYHLLLFQYHHILYDKLLRGLTAVLDVAQYYIRPPSRHIIEATLLY
jgi:hypothetical protein